MNLVQICSATCIACTFYLLGQGWQTTKQILDKNAIINVVAVGGSMYLLLLASNYQSSSSQVGITTTVLVNCALAAEFMVLELLTHNEIKKKKEFLETTLNNDDTPERFNEALKLMLK